MNSTLQERLRGIVGGSGVPRVAPDALECALAPAPVPTVGPGQSRIAAAVLGGRLVEQARGPVVVVERNYGATDRHGRTPIGEITETLLGLPAALDLLARAWPPLPEAIGGIGGRLPVADSRSQSNLWFLDLETTGLAGGAGTQAFLVGCAVLGSDGIGVRQFLLSGFEYEGALLDEVAAWSAARGALVTFNGKSFDMPLIETRYLFHRVPFPLEGMTHFDMLHPARRLWRARGTASSAGEASCSLSALERLLAGVHRVGDVPGFEIPSRYFQFVRSGDARPLEAVLEHNRLDLVSLALVLARTLSLIERGPGATTDAYECLGLARVYDRAGHPNEAEAAYLRAIDLLERIGRDPDTCGDALRRLAWCRRRAGRVHDAADAWQRLADLPRCAADLRNQAREALAIFHEHRSRDLDTARSHVLGILDDDVNLRKRDAAEYRLRRIDRKLAKYGSSAPTLPLS